MMKSKNNRGGLAALAILSALAGCGMLENAAQSAPRQPSPTMKSAKPGRKPGASVAVSQGVYGTLFVHTQGEPDSQSERAAGQEGVEIGVFASGMHLIAKRPLDARGDFKVSVAPGVYMVGIVAKDGQSASGLAMSDFKLVVEGFYTRQNVTIEINRPKPAGGAYGHVAQVTPALRARIKAKNQLSENDLKAALDPTTWQVWLRRTDGQTLLYDDSTALGGAQGGQAAYICKVDGNGDFKIFAPPGRYTAELYSPSKWGYLLSRSAEFDVPANYCVPQNVSVSEIIKEFLNPDITPGDSGFPS